jgi:uncharacterized cofD-like protein
LKNRYGWLRPGVKLKRWVALGTLGIFIISLGIYPIVETINRGSSSNMAYLLFIFPGILILIVSIKEGMSSLVKIYNPKDDNLLGADNINKMIYDKRILIKGPKIVAIGGGSGLSVLLRGLKAYTSNITAIVTVADDGGGSGILREDLGILPPGDIRNCIISLAETESVVKELLRYRFTEGILRGQSFGNLFIAAMTAISPSFEDAIKEMGNVLAVKGRVIPVTNQDVVLCAQLEDGTQVEGESKIPIAQLLANSPIKKVFLKPQNVSPIKEAIEAIKGADAIILGPGSLYTSIIPNLLVDKISEEVQKSKAVKIYVSNVMTQPGETQGYSLSKHIKAIFDHSTISSIDSAIVNNSPISSEIIEEYKKQGAGIVEIDRKKLDEWGIKIVERPLMNAKGHYIRHSSKALAKTVMEIVLEGVYKKDKKRIFDYIFLKELVWEKSLKNKRKKD